MLARLASLRARLLTAMIVAGCAGLLGAYLVESHLRRSDEFAADRQNALSIAHSVARAAAAGATAADLAAIQDVLADQTIVVVRGGSTIYRGPARRRPVELTITVPFPGGRVVSRDYESSSPTGAVSQLDLALVAGALLVLVIGVAFLVATSLVRALRDPIERATEAARRVAAGDLGARIGGIREGEFAELGSTFDDLAARLEAADRDQRRFLADVAHEIATPVNAIRGFAAAIADGTMSSKGERAEALALIESQGRRVDSLLEDLRELTRLDLTEAVRIDDVDIGAVCRDLVRRFAPAAASAGMDLREPGGRGGPFRIRSDRRLIETVLDNLLSNAIRYTPAGGEVVLDVYAKGDSIVIAVRDTGIGIAPEHRTRVFERLYRVDEARDRVSGGSGLGLALAQRAARAIGGHIELESELGVGSEFRLVLPARENRF